MNALDQLDQPRQNLGMGVQQVNIYEAKAQLSKLIESALRGDDVIIARAGKPVVRLVKWAPGTTRTPGIWRGQVRIREGFDDFSSQDDADWYGA